VVNVVKVFIDPGHGGVDPGAVANGLQEKEITLQLAKEIQKILLNEYENIAIKMSRTTDQTVSLNSRTALANHWNADIFLSIHINAGKGTGFESYIYSNVGKMTKKYQDIIHNTIIKQVGFKDRGKKQADFHVLRNTKMPAVLTENGFIDTLQDSDRLKDPEFIRKLARGHVFGLAKALGLKKKDHNVTNSPSSQPLYKVQIGSFKNRKNAELLAEQAVQSGYNVIIIEE
jgi:N-acetylmuramoyl-L-alanine amidase